MNRTIVFLFGSLILLLNCSVAHGQGCATTLAPYFSVYNSISRDGTHIYTSVTMQGYASIYPNPGCKMNLATHHVGAENKLNNVDHWTYSANGCPTCYFSVTDSEGIVGVPGVVYPYLWDGQAICSMVGPFWNGGGSGGIVGCLVPSSETTAVEATVFTTETAFNQQIGDTAGDSFNRTSLHRSNRRKLDRCRRTGSGPTQSLGVR